MAIINENLLCFSSKLIFINFKMGIVEKGFILNPFIFNFNTNNINLKLELSKLDIKK